MIVTGPEGSVRDLHLWEAKPNADWPTYRAVIAAANKPMAQIVQAMMILTGLNGYAPASAAASNWRARVSAASRSSTAASSVGGRTGGAQQQQVLDVARGAGDRGLDVLVRREPALRGERADLVDATLHISSQSLCVI